MTTGAAGVQASQLKQQRWFVAAGRAGFAVSGLVQILIGLAALIEGEVSAVEWVAGLRRAERARSVA